jgi:branched-subunit amino acid transport protein
VSVWAALLAAAAACYALKLAGLSVPPELLEHPVAQRVADLLPTALLSALVAVQVFGSGHALVLDARVAGLGVAVGALLLRAPFLVVVASAAVAAALLRLVG